MTDLNAVVLYEDGWLYTDREALIKAYGLTDSEADQLCEELKALEEAEELQKCPYEVKIAAVSATYSGKGKSGWAIVLLRDLLSDRKQPWVLPVNCHWENRDDCYADWASIDLVGRSYMVKGNLAGVHGDTMRLWRDEGIPPQAADFAFGCAEQAISCADAYKTVKEEVEEND